MRTIKTDATRLTIEQEDGITLDWKRQPDESLAQWYWRSFQLLAQNLGFDDCIQPHPSLAEIGVALTQQVEPVHSMARYTDAERWPESQYGGDGPWNNGGGGPDEPEPPKPTLADFPNGLLGTWWRYSDHQAPGEVTKHDGDSIELDYPTSTDCISVDWLFKAYTRVEAPAEPGGEDVQCECSGHHNPWCIHFNQNLNG